MLMCQFVVLVLVPGCLAFGENTCHQMFTSETGSVTSELLSSDHPNNIECHFFIRPYLARKQILQLTPVTFNLRPGDDILEIRNGSMGGISLGEFTGNIMPILFDKAFYLHFTTDKALEAMEFHFNWTVVEDGVRVPFLASILEVFYNGAWGAVCNRNINTDIAVLACRKLGYNDTAARIVSGGYRRTSEWVTNNGCHVGMVDISQCISRTGRENCWERKAGVVICTNASNTLKTMIREKPASPPDCDERSTRNSGRLTSPDYPLYPNSARCTYTLVSDRLTVLRFSKFDLEEGSDFLEIRETGRTGKLIGRFTGNHLPPVIFFKKLWLQFTSNDKIIASGFEARWEKSSMGMRLENGTRTSEGRLEVYGGDLLGSRWGTACDDYLNDGHARHACYILGYRNVSGTYKVVKNAAFGEGTGKIIYFSCGRGLSSPSECRKSRSYCELNEAVSLQCDPRTEKSSTLFGDSYFLDPMFQGLCQKFVGNIDSKFNETDFQHTLGQLMSKIMMTEAFMNFSSIAEASQSCLNKNNTFCSAVERFNFYSELSEYLNSTDDQDIENIYRFKMSLHKNLRMCGILQLYSDYLPDARKPGDAWRLFKELTGYLSKLKTPLMLSEIDQDCVQPEQPCPLRDVYNLIEKSEMYMPQKYMDRFTKQSKNKYFALTMHTVFLKYNNPGLVGNISKRHSYGDDKFYDDDDWSAVFKRVLEALAEYIDKDELESLQDLLDILPGTISDTLLSNKKSSALWAVWQQTRVYQKTSTIRSKNNGTVKVLHTAVDTKALLRLEQMNSMDYRMTHKAYDIDETSESLWSGMQDASHGRYTKFQTYFRNVIKYHSDVTNDIFNYFDTIHDGVESAESLGKSTGEIVDRILNATILSLGGEAVPEDAKLMSVWLESCNPLRWLSGDSETITVPNEKEYLNQLAKFQKSFGTFQSLLTLKMTTYVLQIGILSSKEYLSKVKVIFDTIRNGKDILDCQHEMDYVHSVDVITNITKKDLMNYGDQISVVVEEACVLLKEHHDKVFEEIQDMFNLHKALAAHYMDLCSWVKPKISKTMSSYAQLLDKSTEMQIVLADLLAANTAIKTNKEIISFYDYLSRSAGNSLRKDFDLAVGLSYVSYKITTKQMIRQLCDQLEYRYLGVQPDICNQTVIDLEALLQIPERQCQSSEFQFHPLPASIDDKAVDIHSLYKQQDITIQFPNTTWMLDEGWITSADLDSITYVSAFEVYIPSELNRPIRVEVYAEAENRLKPNGTSYTFLPNRRMVFKYTRGWSCRQASFNPFGKESASVCPVTEQRDVDSNDLVYQPSILAKYRVRVYGLNEAALQGPSSSYARRLEIGLKTCTFQTGKGRDREDGKRKS